MIKVLGGESLLHPNPIEIIEAIRRSRHSLLDGSELAKRNPGFSGWPK